MTPDVVPGGQSSLPLSRGERRAAAIAGGREKRARNRECLKQRELERERETEKSTSVGFHVVKLLACAIFFLPIFGLGILIVLLLDDRIGTIPAWIVGIGGSVWLAVVVYRGPYLLRTSAHEVLGVFRGRKRDSGTFWWALAWIVGTAILAYASLHKIGML